MLKLSSESRVNPPPPGWVARSAVREAIVRFYCIALYHIMLCSIIFMTHVSVIISVYKYNLQLEIEPWAAAVNSYTGLNPDTL